MFTRDAATSRSESTREARTLTEPVKSQTQIFTPTNIEATSTAATEAVLIKLSFWLIFSWLTLIFKPFRSLVTIPVFRQNTGPGMSLPAHPRASTAHAANQPSGRGGKGSWPDQ